MKKNNSIIFSVSGGLGKNVMASATVHLLKEKYPDKNVIVTSPHRAAWEGHPDVSEIVDLEKTPNFFADYISGTDNIFFGLEPYSNEDYFYARKQLIEIWCDLCNVKYDGSMPILKLTDEERASTKKKLQAKGGSPEKIFVIQTSGGAANQPFPISWARDLPFPIAEEVCIEMKKKGYRPIHLRRADQRGLVHAERIDFTMREAFAAIELSEKRLLIDSFAQHIAAALAKPSVVTWVANNPAIFGYAMHTNLFPNIKPEFRHTLDSFMESFNITGSLHEYPYDTDKIYDTKIILSALDSIS